MAIGGPTRKQTNTIAFRQIAGSRRCRRNGRGSRSSSSYGGGGSGRSSYGGAGHRSSGLKGVRFVVCALFHALVGVEVKLVKG